MQNKLLMACMLGVGLLMALYVLLTVVLYFAQDYLLFHPPSVGEEDLYDAVQPARLQRVELKAQDGTELTAWHFPSLGRRVVIYAHGNAGSLAGSLPIKTHLQQSGWDVLAVGYRGYPGSQGRPSEQGLRQDIRAVYEHAVHGLGVSPKNIVLHGRSLGGGVVGTLMLDVPVAGLVLQSTFTSAADLASEQYPYVPVRMLMKHPFDTSSRASQFQGPVLLLHSDADEVIPVEHARSLAKVFPKAQYVEIQGYHHNDDVLMTDTLAQAAYMRFLDDFVAHEKKTDGG